MKASDKGKPPLEDVCTIAVTIKDINDNPPIFDRANYDVPVAAVRFYFINIWPTLTKLFLKLIKGFPSSNSVLRYFVRSCFQIKTMDVSYQRNSLSFALMFLKQERSKWKSTIYWLNTLKYLMTVIRFFTLILSMIYFMNTNNTQLIFDSLFWLWNIVQDMEVNKLIMRVSATDVDEGENQRITYELRPDRFPADLDYFK